MALDFRGYADAYAKGRDRFDETEHPSNYTKLFGTPEHSFIKNTKRDLNASMDPLLQASMLDVKDWNSGAVDFSQMKSAGTAYMDWKRNLNKPLNFRASNYARENNLDNFITFKQQYDQQMAAYAPMVMNKLQNHQASNYLSDNQMREMLQQYPGLQNVLRQAPQQVDAQGLPQAMPAWTMPKESWGQYTSRKTSGAMPGAGALAAIRGGQAAYGIGTKGLGGYMTSRSPFGKESVLKAKDKKAIAKALGVNVKSGKMSVSKSPAQGRATSAYNKAEKLYKKNELSKIRKTQPRGKISKAKMSAIKAFDKTPAGSKLFKAKESAIKANEAQKKLVKGKPAKAIGSFIKKHGIGGLYKKVVQKVGISGAAKLLTKGALGMGLKGTGVGAGFGLALDAYTLYQLYNIITSD